MTFNSLEEMISYIENTQSSIMPDLADEIKNVIDREVHNQVTGWSGQIFDSVVPYSTSNTAEAGFEDTGDWTSLVTGESVGNPIKFLESGSTWNRGQSFIMDASEAEAESVIPREYLQLMRSKGIPIK